MARKGCNLELGTLCGVEAWRIRFQSVPGKYGEVDWEQRLIAIDPNQSIEELTDTVCHEIAHVATSDALSEDAVSHIAGGVTAALLKLRLIRTEED
jgi:hypothetical protein